MIRSTRQATRSTRLPLVVLVFPFALLVFPLVVLIFPLAVLIFPHVVLVCPLVVLICLLVVSVCTFVISVCPLVVLVLISVGLFMTDQKNILLQSNCLLSQKIKYLRSPLILYLRKMVKRGYRNGTLLTLNIFIVNFEHILCSIVYIV